VQRRRHSRSPTLSNRHDLPGSTAMSQTMMIAIAIALGIAALYFLVMRVFYKEGKELDKKIDYTKIKAWKDED
jgi:low affinity Fe/Cu permease